MPGFPTRISRAMFGPPLTNFGGVAGDPTKCVDKDRWELVFRQLSGCGLTNPLVTVAFLSAATTEGLSLENVHAAWNPSESTDPIYAVTLERSAQGIYLVQCPASVPDIDGNDVAIDLQDCIGSGKFRATSGWSASFRVIAPNVVEVMLADDIDAAVDLDSGSPVRLFFAAW